MRRYLVGATVTAETPPTAIEIQEAARARADRQSHELIVTRERAANWSKGIGALLVAALAFSLIKGRDDLTEVDPKWAGAVGVALVLAAALATVAAYSLFRASYGPLEPLKDVTDHAEAVSTMTALKTGLGFAVAAFVLLLVAVGATWYGPDADGPRIKVTGKDIDWCGVPQTTSSGVLKLKVDGQPVNIDLSDVDRIEAVDSCPD
ncbi:hypothetical protein [Nocardioides sp. 1609]|uniref:hypothetical protein n=1 Tax=Nocardioides sp. 1609 TaxID=2508327 RepID=UPI00106F96A2|nr:hypothetical protein [Nocardioides sp. 1609]